ncbi:hypothetical protein BG004_005503 [Podila humilis]|nr:hypothetical protein BG004_005503 [Podila humilis]
MADQDKDDPHTNDTICSTKGSTRSTASINNDSFSTLPRPVANDPATSVTESTFNVHRRISTARTANPDRQDAPTGLPLAMSSFGSGASSGFALPASNPFTMNTEPLNPFSPVVTPVDTPIPTPLGSPTQELRKLTLGVERYAKAIEDSGVMGSFSGTVPLPQLSQNHPIASKRRPSNILGDPMSTGMPESSHEHGSNNNILSGLNLNLLKRAFSGKSRQKDFNMADIEHNNDNDNDNDSNNDTSKNLTSIDDIGNPFSTSTKPGIADAQVSLLGSLAASPQPILLPTMPTMNPEQEALNESRSTVNHHILRQRHEQMMIHRQPETAVTVDQPTTSSGMRRRKPKGGILSQLLKLQRNEAAAAAASGTGTGSPASRGGPTAAAQHPAVKKTRKGFYYRSSSKNNSLADLHASPSVTTTPRVSPRNSRVFDMDHQGSSTRLPTQPSTTINNNNTSSSRPLNAQRSIEEMEAISAVASAATVAANLGIHRDIADILSRQSFLITIAKALILYGAPTHRIEETCALLARKMEVDASFALLPGLMTISFSDPETHTSDTRHLRCTQGMDMYKLSKVYTIALEVLHGGRIEAANKSLEKVTIEPGYYPVWVTILAWMSAAAFVAPLAFHGSWLDTALAGLCGLIVGLLGVAAAKLPVYGNVFEVTSSIVVGFIARAFGEHVCFSAVTLAGVVVLLPGLLLTQSIMELASRNIVSGAVRMFYALMYAFFLGFGLSLGSELWDYVSGTKYVAPPQDCMRGVNPWWYFFIFPAVSTSINIVFNAHPSQWIGMTCVSSVGFTVSYFMKASPQVTATIAAFAVGIAGQMYGRLTGKLSYVPLLSGVLLLVPGSVGVRGVLAIIGSDPSQGFNFALVMVNTSVAITLGVFCSALVWYPFWRKSTFMNF